MQGLSEGRGATKRRDQSLWTSVRRFWYIVLGTGVLAVILGGVYGFVNPSDPVYGADVTIVVQDPATAVAGGTTSARFVASQAELLRSDIVASAAAEDLAQLDPPVMVEPFDLIAGTTVTFSGDSSILVVEFVDSDPDMAVLKANAITDVFNQVSRLQVTGFSENALARIDAQLEAFNQRQAEIAEELRAIRDENVGLAILERQHAEAIAQIGALQEERKSTTSVERLDAIRIAIDDLRTQIDVYQQALDAQEVSPQLRALNEETDLIIARRAEVLTQRDQISIEAELAPGAVVSLLPALEAFEFPSLGISRVIAIALIIGLALGAGIAHMLSTRLLTFRNRSEPEEILGAPLLADIPDFELEGVESSLPVRDAPRSVAAEAFRFAAASLELRMRGQGARVVMVVSSTLGHGKSTSLVNTALASARQGHSVLVIDCDFGNQHASNLLRGESPHPPPGFTDVVEVGRPLETSIQRIQLGNGVSMGLLSRGRLPSIAADTLRSPGARDLFAAVGNTYDLVFVDAPPLLQVAYASTVAAYVDSLVVVVKHGTSARELEDLTARLDLIGTPVAGYLYNKSPIRAQMTATGGSMKDILGDGLVSIASGGREDLPRSR
jgi:Mrp family chromosome partitioning ATPase/capsular polysaccharide biosynthesis protein